MRDSPEVTPRDAERTETPPAREPVPAAPPSPPPEPAVPYPPRFRWLRRMTFLALALAALLVGARAWWAHEVDRRLRADMAAARARGEPTLPEDFDPAPIPDAENAAPLYLRAMDAMKLTEAELFFMRDLRYGDPPKPGDAARADQILVKAADGLRLARLAGERPRASWQNMVFRSPVFRNAPSMDDYWLGLLLRLAGERAIARGDHALAAAVWRDTARFAARLLTANAVSKSDEEATRVQWWACEMIERHAHGLRIGAAGERASAPGAGSSAAEADVREVIRLLLEDAEWRRAEARVWSAFRMAMWDSARREGTATTGPRAWRLYEAAVRPLDRMEKLRSARLKGIAAEVVAAADDVPALRSRHAQRPPPRLRTGANAMTMGRSRLDRLAHPDSDDDSYGSADYVATTYFRDVGERHMAAVALAVRLYRNDRGGAWPATVESLVPAYLPHAPADPFAADGRPLKLAVIDGRAAVYSVGRNGVDDGGSAGGFSYPKGPPRGEARWAPGAASAARAPPPPPPARPPPPPATAAPVTGPGFEGDEAEVGDGRRQRDRGEGEQQRPARRQHEHRGQPPRRRSRSPAEQPQRVDEEQQRDEHRQAVGGDRKPLHRRPRAGGPRRARDRPGGRRPFRAEEQQGRGGAARSARTRSG